MSLIEIMIAMVLATLISTFLLMLTRTQISAYELNDQLSKAQQNARSGIDYLETQLRRACGGISVGRVGINVPGVAQTVQPCVRVFDGPNFDPTLPSFANGAAASQPDAIELIFPTGVLTATTGDVTAASVNVVSITGFAVDDFVLVTDYSQAVLLKIQSITPTGGPPMNPGTLNFYSPGGALLVPTAAGTAPAFIPSFTPSAPNAVFRAESVAIYVENGASARPEFRDMLMLDPDGMAGANHADAEPLIEGVEDFQLAVGIDGNGDGLLTDTGGIDEWLGNASGELPLPLPPWNRNPVSFPADSQLRSIRISLLVKTTNTYPGALLPVAGVGRIEDRTSFPTYAGTAPPRYRPIRISVSPRLWNLRE